MLNRILNFRRDEKILRRFYRSIPDLENPRGKVLLYAGISSMFVTHLEILLFHLLRKNGFDVDYLVYDGAAPIFETVTNKTPDPDTAPKRNWRYGKRMLEAASVQHYNIPISSHANKIVEDLVDIDSIMRFEYEGIDFGNIVHGTLCRYYQATEFGRDVDSVARKMLRTALSNYLCAKDRHSKYEYDFMLFSHGINITWQPVVEFCRRNQVPFVCYDRAKVKEHCNFNMNHSSADWSFDSAWARYADRELSSDELATAQRYLQDRELQQGDVFAFNSAPRAENVVSEKLRLGIPADRKCITFFSNLIWDAANVSRDIAFTSFLDCLVKSIEYFADRRDVQILIRPHPAETLIGTQAGYWDLVTDHFGNDLPDNVTLISPQDEVNSFTMIDISTIGVVNTSTVGLEMAMLGKQTLLVAETHYRGKGFTNDVTSPEHFFESAENALKDPSLSETKRQLAMKYFYMMMFLYQKHMPVRYQDNRFAGYSSATFDDLDPSEPIVRIVDQLVEGLPDDFVEWSVASGAAG